MHKSFVELTQTKTNPISYFILIYNQILLPFLFCVCLSFRFSARLTLAILIVSTENDEIHYTLQNPKQRINKKRSKNSKSRRNRERENLRILCSDRLDS